jgi:hypothetical protein
MQTAPLLSETQIAHLDMPNPPKGRPVGVIAKGLRVKAWRAIRGFKKTSDHCPNFTLGDILDIVATGAHKNAPNNLLKYLACLERHGVITRLARRVPGSAPTSLGAVIWQLSNDLGWYAPVWRQVQKVLWNPNTSSIVPLQTRATDGAVKLPTPPTPPPRKSGNAASAWPLSRAGSPSCARPRQTLAKAAAPA